MLTPTVRDTRLGRTLRPVAASTLAPAWLHGEPGPAHVAAVFDVAVYLRRDQEVLPLLGPGALALPGGLRVAARADLDDLGLRIGDEVTVGAGRVIAHDGGLVVARTWRPQPIPSAELSPSARATALSALAGSPHVEGDHDLGLAALARQVVQDSARGPLAQLVGLGPGLTPAGDDVLCGLLLALRATGRERDRAALEGAVNPLLSRTTALSATLLRHAAGGYAVPPLVALLRAWHRVDRDGQARDRRADEERLAVLGAEVATVGHTSGPALLLGLATVLAEPSLDADMPLAGQPAEHQEDDR